MQLCVCARTRMRACVYIRAYEYTYTHMPMFIRIQVMCRPWHRSNGNVLYVCIQNNVHLHHTLRCGDRGTAQMGTAQMGIYICMYVHAWNYICIRFACMCMHEILYACANMHVCVYIFIQSACIYICIHVYMYSYNPHANIISYIFSFTCRHCGDRGADQWDCLQGPRA